MLKLYQHCQVLFTRTSLNQIEKDTQARAMDHQRPVRRDVKRREPAHQITQRISTFTQTSLVEPMCCWHFYFVLVRGRQIPNGAKETGLFSWSIHTCAVTHDSAKQLPSRYVRPMGESQLDVAHEQPMPLSTRQSGAEP